MVHAHHVPLTHHVPLELLWKAGTQVRKEVGSSREQHLGCAGLRGHAGAEVAAQPGTNCGFPASCPCDANWLWAQLTGGVGEITILVHKRTQNPGDFIKKLN